MFGKQTETDEPLLLPQILQAEVLDADELHALTREVSKALPVADHAAIEWAPLMEAVRLCASLAPKDQRDRLRVMFSKGCASLCAFWCWRAMLC